MPRVIDRPDIRALSPIGEVERLTTENTSLRAANAALRGELERIRDVVCDEDRDIIDAVLADAL